MADDTVGARLPNKELPHMVGIWLPYGEPFFCRATDRGASLESLHVRRAIQYAINRDEINDLIYFGKFPGVICPGFAVLWALLDSSLAATGNVCVYRISCMLYPA